MEGAHRLVQEWRCDEVGIPGNVLGELATLCSNASSGRTRRSN
jgi:hypothetical protein